MSSQNPQLRRFLSRSNMEFLYSTIIDAIIETHNFNIREGEFRSLLKRTMKYVSEIIPEEEMSLELLNKETSNRTAREIVSHIQKETQKFRNQELAKKRQNESQLQSKQKQKPNVPQLKVSPPNHDSYSERDLYRNEDRYDRYNQVVSEQSDHELNGVPIPNFEDVLPDPNTLPDIDSLYQNAEHERQISDVMSPPNIETKEIFKRNGQEVRNRPKKYEIPKKKTSHHRSPQERPQERRQERPQERRQERPQERYQERSQERHQQRSQERYQEGPQERRSHRNQPKMSTKISDLNNRNVTAPYEEPFIGDLNNYSSQNKFAHIQENEDEYDSFSSEAISPVISPGITSQLSITNEQEIKGQIKGDEIADYMDRTDPRNDLHINPVAEVARLIPKTSRNLVPDSKIIPHIYVVDSRDRDESVYPDPNSYRIRTPEYKDVVSISLEDAQIPITGYVINENNNMLYFQEEMDITQIAEIPIGNYDSDELATAIEDALNATSANGITYSVVNDTLTSKYIITSGAVLPFIFNLLFFGGLESFSSVNEPNKNSEAIYIDNSMGPVIGFDKKNYTGSLSYSSKFVYNLAGEKYIIMYIEEADMIEANQSSIHRGFAKITLNAPFGSIKFYDNKDRIYEKFFSPTIGKLSNLTIKFRTYNGDLYNFNGQDHSFTLKIVTKDITQGPY